MTSSDNSSDQPFVASAGVTPVVADHRDPYEVLDDLMTVVEALCNDWPQRDVFMTAGKMLL
ncbi:MAG: hypothetical protein ABW110_12095 [Steroidobacteraceae bacterium]